MPEISVVGQPVDRWFFGGGAEHTPESARRLTYAATSGSEGVGGPSELKVRPLAVPGAGVRVSIGSALILSRYTGGEKQTYMGTAYQQVEVATTPTGSGGGRSDLIVFRVEDPHAAGTPWTLPAGADPATEQYVYVRVISGVPGGTTRLQDVPGYQNDTAITLARIDFPASTGTVTTGMITDLRKVALPRERTLVRAFGLSGTGVTEILTNTSAYPAGETWPDAAIAGGALAVDVPAWATQVTAVLTVSGVKVPGGGSAMGWFWTQIGQSVNPDKIITEPTRWDVDEASAQHRTMLMTADTKSVPAGLRGTRQNVYPRANKTTGADAKSYVADSGTTVTLTVVFREVPE